MAVGSSGHRGVLIALADILGGACPPCVASRRFSRRAEISGGEKSACCAPDCGTDPPLSAALWGELAIERAGCGTFACDIDCAADFGSSAANMFGGSFDGVATLDDHTVCGALTDLNGLPGTGMRRNISFFGGTGGAGAAASPQCSLDSVASPLADVDADVENGNGPPASEARDGISMGELGGICAIRGLTGPRASSCPLVARSMRPAASEGARRLDGLCESNTGRLRRTNFATCVMHSCRNYYEAVTHLLAMATRLFSDVDGMQLSPSEDESDSDDLLPAQAPSICGQNVSITYYGDAQRAPRLGASADGERDAHTVHLNMDMSAGCGGKIWPAAEVLGAYIAASRTRCGAAAAHPWRGKTVVELGSGTGLLGFLVAKMGIGCDVWITDQEPMLPLMRQNMALNDLRDACHVAELNWGEPLPADVPSKPDVLLLADCVYLESAFQPLVDTMHDLATEKTEILFCYHRRRKVRLAGRAALSAGGQALLHPRWAALYNRGRGRRRRLTQERVQ